MHSNSYTTYRHRPNALSCKKNAHFSLHFCNSLRANLAHSFEGRGKSGARGRGCTCTDDVLNVVSLLLDYASKRNGLLDYWIDGAAFLHSTPHVTRHLSLLRASRRCCPGMISLQKRSAGCCKEAREGLDLWIIGFMDWCGRRPGVPGPSNNPLFH